MNTKCVMRGECVVTTSWGLGLALRMSTSVQFEELVTGITLFHS